VLRFKEPRPRHQVAAIDPNRPGSDEEAIEAFVPNACQICFGRLTQAPLQRSRQFERLRGYSTYGKTNPRCNALIRRPRALQAPLAAKLAAGPGLDGQRVSIVPLAF
jgi:hypothetical protein